ncbi:hypothetical protein GUITHDRAFT_145537 [Guillardia theta CCMP2712]|uniref:Transmembrane protein 65 n=1 Tax=Guillardia theta (strain CCMP2712) TaxID=905079 RepID=L1IL98_GUITC|nr:hypothetical protein GUITHDRAFT_145537 [Guillardia theta CCMP2712]EKX36674.1 hypothetical protein GUITHDRAFT_145537 [Guillardia theta CCMP2712]|eukprot:XP_005823654.1 hypothetical protein GUITHDRAFT_145537 [Guillardia theta CCMP2712]
MLLASRFLSILLLLHCTASLPLDPRKHPAECGRSSPSWVCDPDEVLGEQAADRIDMVARSINAGGTKIAVSVMKKLKEDYGKDNKSDDKKVWSCSSAGSRAAKAIITLWSADALVLLSQDDKNFCVVTRGTRIPLSQDDTDSILMDVQDPLINGIPEYAVMFAILRMKLFASGMIPFIGFGMTDNGLMIICGEIIEEFLGKRLGLSAMGAAAWGNLLSDMAGVFLGGTVNQIAQRIGATEPVLTHAQKSLPIAVQSKLLGEALGVGFGCWLGMAPLMFSKSEEGETSNRECGIRRELSETGFSA